MVPFASVGSLVVVVGEVLGEGFSELGDASGFVAGEVGGPEFAEEGVVDLFDFAVGLGAVDESVFDAELGEGVGESVGDELVAVVGGHCLECPLVGGEVEGDLVGEGGGVDG